VGRCLCWAYALQCWHERVSTCAATARKHTWRCRGQTGARFGACGKWGGVRQQSRAPSCGCREQRLHSRGPDCLAWTAKQAQATAEACCSAQSQTGGAWNSEQAVGRRTAQGRQAQACLACGPAQAEWRGGVQLWSKAQG